MYIIMSDSIFRGKGNQNLLVLRDILITYSAYHQGIVQMTLITDHYQPFSDFFHLLQL